MQLIESRGFLAETHYITSSDGYILTVQRILNPFVKNRTKLRPIILHHGLHSNANAWIINSNGILNNRGEYLEENNRSTVGNTLGFVLAVNGFNVWRI